MRNMGYCRFENTVGDLNDCLEHMEDNKLSPREHQMRVRLVVLCASVLGSLGMDIDDEEAKRFASELPMDKDEDEEGS